MNLRPHFTQSMVVISNGSPYVKLRFSFKDVYFRGMMVHYRSNFHNPHLKISAKKRFFSAYTRTDRTLSHFRVKYPTLCQWYLGSRLYFETWKSPDEQPMIGNDGVVMNNYGTLEDEVDGELSKKSSKEDIQALMKISPSHQKINSDLTNDQIDSTLNRHSSNFYWKPFKLLDL